MSHNDTVRPAPESKIIDVLQAINRAATSLMFSGLVVKAVKVSGAQLLRGVEIRRLIKRLIPRRKPPILYHYTSGSGLLGILRSKSIWATRIRFLNDSSEYDFAVRLARNVIRERARGVRSKYEQALYAVLEERLMGVVDPDVYVSSFTENADQLSQWRAYCSPRSGYAIGFTSQFLGKSPVEKLDQFLTRCLYRSSAQEELIGDLVDEVLATAANIQQTGVGQDRVFRESYKVLGRLLPIVAPILKDPSFEEEQEWRLVRLGMSFEGLPRFRIGNSTLVPYYEHMLPNSPKPLPIEEVLIGPTPHPQLALEATQALFSSHGLASVTIRCSAIPYRNW